MYVCMCMYVYIYIYVCVCVCVCVGLPIEAIHRLQLAHNAAARVVTPLLRDLYWLPILKHI